MTANNGIISWCRALQCVLYCIGILQQMQGLQSVEAVKWNASRAMMCEACKRHVCAKRVRTACEDGENMPIPDVSGVGVLPAQQSTDS